MIIGGTSSGLPSQGSAYAAPGRRSLVSTSGTIYGTYAGHVATGNASSGTLTANRTYGSLVVLNEDRVLDQLYCQVVTAVNPSTFRVGICSLDATLQPDNKFARDLGAVDSSTTGMRYITDINQRLPAGRYCVLLNSASALAFQVVTGFWAIGPSIQYGSISSNPAAFGWWTVVQDLAGGPFPSTPVGYPNTGSAGWGALPASYFAQVYSA